MANQQNSYTGSQGTGTNSADFPFTFPSFTTGEVKVEVDNVVKTLTTHYTVENYNTTSGGTVRFTAGNIPTGTTPVRIFRQTDVDNPKATFTAGSSLKAGEINDNFKQVRHALQEAIGAAATDRKVQRFNIEADSIDGTLIADDVVDSEHYVAGSIDLEHMSANSVDSDQYVDGSIDGVHIANDQIDSQHYAAGSIDLEHMSANSVDSDQYVDGSIDLIHMSANSVDSDQYVDGSIDRVHLEADIIDGTKLADNAVNSEHYVDGSIDHEHLANDVIDGDNIQNDVVDSEHIAAGALDNEHYAAGSITSDKLSDATVVTNAEQAASTPNDTSFFTTAAAEARYFNASTGETIKDGQTFPDNDTTIATTAAINDRIIDLVDDVGGFVPIANETSFPTSNPDVNNGTGTLVSIKEISSTRTPSTGTVTIANGAGTGNTVTITGCGSTVLTAGFGVIVETTTTLHTYAFHRLVPKATEVTTVAGVSGNVTTVAGIASNVTTVANNNANVSTVAGSITNVNNVGNSIASVNTAASNLTSINKYGDQYQVASSNPATDGGGNALAEGDLYFNTTANELKVYNGSQWQGGVTASGNFAAITGNTFTGDNVYTDNAKLKLGTGSDLEIFHNANDSIINDAGQGDLKIQSGGSTKIQVTSSGAVVTGDITVTGSVDGRDVAADGTKLDTVETNAKDDQTAAEIKTLLQSNKLTNAEIADETITLAKLPHGTSSNNGKFLRANNGADPTFETVNTDLVGDTSPQLGGTLDTNGQNIEFKGAGNATCITYDASQDRLEVADNKSIVFGNHPDVSLSYSNGNDFYLTGIYNGSDDIVIGHSNNAGTPIPIIKAIRGSGASGGGSAELWWNDASAGTSGAKKLETTSSGISVTGVGAFTGGVSASSLTTNSGNIIINSQTPTVSFVDSDANPDYEIKVNGGVFDIRDSTNNASKFSISSGELAANAKLNCQAGLDTDGDVRFNSGSTNVHLNWDASGQALEFSDNVTAIWGDGADLIIRHSSSDGNSYIEESGSGSLVVRADDYYVQNSGANHTQIKSDSNADVELSHNGTAKFQTTADGVKVLGTGDITIPSGNTSQRSGTASAGSMRYNTQTSQLEIHNGTSWVGVGKSTPQIFSVTNQTTTGVAGTTMVIKGEGFVSGCTVHYVGTDGTNLAAQSITFNSSTQLTVTNPLLIVANAPYAIKVTNPDGGLIVAAPEVEVTAGSAPNWTTATGQLGGGSIQKNAAVNITVAASDADGQAITYSETTSVLTSNSNTPASTMNLSLNSSTGVISGTSPNVTADTTYNFTLRATDTATNYSDRNFYIIVQAAPPPSYWFRGTSQGGNGLASGVTWSHTGYYPNATGGSNANADRLYNYGQGNSGTYAGFRQTGYTNGITIPVGHDRCDIYISSIARYNYSNGNQWTSTQPSGNSTGTGAFGNLMSNPSTGLHTYTIPSADQGQVRYFIMSGYAGQNGSWSQEVTLVKTYNQNNP